MDTPVGTKDYAPRGTERARPPRARRGARRGRFWRSALVALALAVAVVALLATRARAQPVGSAPVRAIRVGIVGNSSLGGLGNVTLRFPSGPLPPYIL